MNKPLDERKRYLTDERSSSPMNRLIKLRILKPLS